MGILTLTYDSTHYYLVDCLGGKLLVDAGMAGTLPKFQAGLRRYGLEFSALRFVMMTHAHPDHAGILQEIRERSGARLVILEKQIPFLDELRAFYAPKGGYDPIRLDPTDLRLGADNRAALRRIGVQGEIVETPGHSPDSVSLLLESGEAFVGDLNPFYFEDAQKEGESRASWQRLIAGGARVIYPAHANPVGIAEIKRLLGL